MEMGIRGKNRLRVRGEGWGVPSIFGLAEATDFVKPGIQERSGSWTGSRETNNFQLQQIRMETGGGFISQECKRKNG